MVGAHPHPKRMKWSTEHRSEIWKSPNMIQKRRGYLIIGALMIQGRPATNSQAETSQAGGSGAPRPRCGAPGVGLGLGAEGSSLEDSSLDAVGSRSPSPTSHSSAAGNASESPPPMQAHAASSMRAGPNSGLAETPLYVSESPLPHPCESPQLFHVGTQVQSGMTVGHSNA